MQKPACLMTAVFLTLFAVAQKTELGIGVHTGWMSFAGVSAQRSSFFNYHSVTGSGYTNNPYGASAQAGIGFSAALSRVCRNQFILGLQLGYERLTPKLSIVQISSYTASGNYSEDAVGKCLLNYRFLNLFPHLGYRVHTPKLNLDLVAGFDIAHCISATENGLVHSAGGITYRSRLNRKTIATDLRPRLQLAASHYRAGIYLDYAFGMVNYKSGYLGGVNECFARVVRFGVRYVLK